MPLPSHREPSPAALPVRINCSICPWHVVRPVQLSLNGWGLFQAAKCESWMVGHQVRLLSGTNTITAVSIQNNLTMAVKLSMLLCRKLKSEDGGISPFGLDVDAMLACLSILVRKIDNANDGCFRNRIWKDKYAPKPKEAT